MSTYHIRPDHQNDAETTAMMQKFGYWLNYDHLEAEHMQLNDEPLSYGSRRLFADCSLYALMAYRAGLAGKSLTHTLPFLRKIESAPAAGTAETQQEPKPQTLALVYHGNADDVKEVLP